MAAIICNDGVFYYRWILFFFAIAAAPFSRSEFNVFAFADYGKKIIDRCHTFLGSLICLLQSA